ncbi:MAG: hypothetical protein AB8H86_31230 [Polyangiales bacterium]
MRIRRACNTTRIWFHALSPKMRVRLSVLVLLGLAFAVEPEARLALRGLRHVHWTGGLQLLFAALMGVAVGRTKATALRRPSMVALAIVAFVLMPSQMSWELPRRETLAWLSIGYLPLVFLAFVSRERAPTFVLGFLLAGLSLADLWNQHLLFAVFLLARDFNHLREMAERQAVALLGTGLIAGFLVLSLSFDLAASFEYDPNYAVGFEYGFFESRPHGFVGDAPIPRWTRMLTEALLIVACLAHLRGRTWGVLGLACLLPVLAYQIRSVGIQYPFYSGIGICFSARHPLRDTVLEKSVALLAIGPWLWPMLRSLARSERSQHA